MLYNEACGEKLSGLGFGCMRLPQTPDKAIDETELQRMVDYAVEHGVNYFDTAYPYHGGMSEICIGKALSKYPREKWFLADKYPGHQIASSYHPAEIFEEQLKKCGVEYFDFYLLHNVCENSLNFYNDPEIRIVDYLLEQKTLGKIRHLGFSSHAVSAATIDEFLTRYEGVFEFVQIQLNYLDWILQDAKSKVEVIAKHGLKIVVMEGIRGGRLASLPEEQAARLRAVRKEDSAARWALRWLQGIPEVAVILSGMSTIDQIIENVETFGEHNPVSEAEKALLTEVAESMLSWVPCTACRYCTEGCPTGLEIPKIIAAYNGVKNGDHMAWYNPADKGEAMDPARCIGCGNCTSICPQNIAVPEIMKDFSGMMQNREHK